MARASIRTRSVRPIYTTYFVSTVFSQSFFFLFFFADAPTGKWTTQLLLLQNRKKQANKQNSIPNLISKNRTFSSGWKIFCCLLSREFHYSRHAISCCAEFRFCFSLFVTGRAFFWARFDVPRTWNCASSGNWGTPRDMVRNLTAIFIFFLQTADSPITQIERKKDKTK